MKTLLSLAFTFALAGAFAITLAGNASAQQPQPAAPTLDQLKARNFTVTTFDGKRISLNKLLEEGKPVVLDFWATWCGPCRQEIPHLNEIDKKHGKNGLIVIGLNLENPLEDRQAAQNFVREFGMKYQNVFAPGQIYQFFNGAASSYRIPQTIVFGADGKLIKRLVGFSPQAGRAALTSAVEQAMRTREIGARQTAE
ncbi:MAG: Thiol-disulfide oxidoreductase ResA [Acidobacteria bacterium]|nr:Thiol-disulfide oxidoreductase ResA [Acidobacteriota bacterium]